MKESKEEIQETTFINWGLEHGIELGTSHGQHNKVNEQLLLTGGGGDETPGMKPQMVQCRLMGGGEFLFTDAVCFKFPLK